MQDELEAESQAQFAASYAAKAFLGDSQLATQFHGTQFSARSAVPQQEEDSNVSHVSESVPPTASNLSGANLFPKTFPDDSGEDTQAVMTALACYASNAGTFSAEAEMQRLAQAHQDAGRLSRSHSEINGEVSMSIDQDQGIDPSATYPQGPESSSGQEIARLVQQRPQPWLRTSLGSNASDLRGDRSGQSENLSHDFSTISHAGDISAASLPDSPGDLSHAPHSTAHHKSNRTNTSANITFPELPEDPFLPKSAHTSNTTNKSTDYLVAIPMTTTTTPKRAKAKRRVSWQDGQDGQEGEEESQSMVFDFRMPPAPPKPKSPLVSPQPLPQFPLQAPSAPVDDAPYFPPMHKPVPPSEEEEFQESVILRGTGDTTMTSENEPMEEATQPAPQDELPSLMESSKHSESMRKQQRERFASMLSSSIEKEQADLEKVSAGRRFVSPEREAISRRQSSSPDPELNALDMRDTQGMLSTIHQATAGYEDSQLPDPPTSSPPPFLQDQLDHIPPSVEEVVQQMSLKSTDKSVIPDSEEAAKDFSVCITPSQDSADIPLARLAASPKAAPAKRTALTENKQLTVRSATNAGPSSPHPLSKARNLKRHTSPLSEPESDPNEHPLTSDDDFEETNYEEPPAAAKRKSRDGVTTRRQSGCAPAKKTTRTSGKKGKAAEKSKPPVSKASSRASTSRKRVEDAEADERPAKKKARTYKGRGSKGKERAEPEPEVEQQLDMNLAGEMVDEPETYHEESVVETALEQEACGIEKPAVPGLPLNRVFAYWKDDKSYYPSEIIGVEKDRLEVRFDDGSVTFNSYKDVRRCEIKVNDPIFYCGMEETQHQAQYLYSLQRVYRVEWADESGKVVPAGTPLGARVILACHANAEHTAKRRLLVGAIRVPTTPKEHSSVLADRKLTSDQLAAFKAYAERKASAQTLIIKPRETRRGSSAVPDRRAPSVAVSDRASMPPPVRPGPTPTTNRQSASGRTVSVSGNLFKGYGFILTGYEDGDPAPPSPDAPPTVGHYRSSNKQVVSERIRREGGVVIDDLGEMVRTVEGEDGLQLAFQTSGKHCNLNSIFCLSDRPRPLEKYLMALALGIPCISTRWVDESIESGSRPAWDLYMLGAGFSIDLGGHSFGMQGRLIQQTSFSLADVEERHEQMRIFKDLNFLLITAGPVNKSVRVLSLCSDKL